MRRARSAAPHNGYLLASSSARYQIEFDCTVGETPRMGSVDSTLEPAVGRSVACADRLDKATGATRYLDDLPADGAWHDHELTLDATETIYALRLDPGDRPGEASIDRLTLRSASGEIVGLWPVEQRGATP